MCWGAAHSVPIFTEHVLRSEAFPIEGLAFGWALYGIALLFFDTNYATSDSSGPFQFTQDWNDEKKAITAAASKLLGSPCLPREVLTVTVPPAALMARAKASAFCERKTEWS